VIVVCGEALMDVFDAGPHARGEHLDARIGGSPFNVAVGLSRLQQAVMFCGGISRRFLGQRLLQGLRDEGVDTRAVELLDAPCAVCMVGLDAQGVPAYDFMGERSADRLVTPAVLAQVPADVQAVQVGSYAMVVEPVAAMQRALVERQQAHSLIAYDPNVRLVVEPDVQRWRDTLTWMAGRSHLLKVSDEDLGLLFPGADPQDMAQAWLAAGVQWVVVTRGAEGASAWHAQAGRVDVPPVATQVVDTVGAGDTFQACLLAGLSERGLLSPQGVRRLDTHSAREVLAFAATGAALTCSRRGADLPRRQELPSLG
jgi:fructokinase